MSHINKIKTTVSVLSSTMEQASRLFPRESFSEATTNAFRRLAILDRMIRGDVPHEDLVKTLDEWRGADAAYTPAEERVR